MSDDAYPKLSREHLDWLTDLLDGMVSRPHELNFARVRAGNDLEIMIRPAPADRAIFTAEVCLALETIVAATTGYISPVIYLEGDPHARARDAMHAARSSI